MTEFWRVFWPVMLGAAGCLAAGGLMLAADPARGQVRSAFLLLAASAVFSATAAGVITLIDWGHYLS